jgi:uncharacterized protein (TIGR00369 family)
MAVNTLTFEELAPRVRRAPYHQWLGVELTALDDEGIEITLPWRDEFLSSVEPPYGHGGIIAALIDLAADFAVAARAGRGAPTVDLRVDYLRAAGPGPLRARARVLRLGRSLATAEADVFDQAERKVASGRAVFFMGNGG